MDLAVAPLRRLHVACQTRIPAACEGLANERSILGRLLYKNNLQHNRHTHHSRLIPVFTGTDTLIDCCQLECLKALADTLASSAARTTVDAELPEAKKLSVILCCIVTQAMALRKRVQAAATALCPLISKGFFVPFALSACAVLGRLFALAGEALDAVAAAQKVLPQSIKEPLATPGMAKSKPLAQPSLQVSERVLESHVPTVFPTASVTGASIKPASTDLIIEQVRVETPSQAAQLIQKCMLGRVSHEKVADDDMGEPVSIDTLHTEPSLPSRRCMQTAEHLVDDDMGEPVHGESLLTAPFTQAVTAALIPAPSTQSAAPHSLERVCLDNVASDYIAAQVNIDTIHTPQGQPSQRITQTAACAADDDDMGEPIIVESFSGAQQVHPHQEEVHDGVSQFGVDNHEKRPSISESMIASSASQYNKASAPAHSAGDSVGSVGVFESSNVVSIDNAEGPAQAGGREEDDTTGLFSFDVVGEGRGSSPYRQLTGGEDEDEDEEDEEEEEAEGEAEMATQVECVKTAESAAFFQDFGSGVPDKEMTNEAAAKGQVSALEAQDASLQEREPVVIVKPIERSFVGTPILKALASSVSSRRPLTIQPRILSHAPIRWRCAKNVCQKRKLGPLHGRGAARLRLLRMLRHNRPKLIEAQKEGG